MSYAPDRAAFDPSDMHGAIAAFPEHLAQGRSRGDAARGFGLNVADFDGVVICGMGGSAIGGDLVRALAEPEAPCPVVVNRGYALPGWVGPRTLVVASSYSGGTEETLAAFAEARRRGATVAVVTSGGEIAELARADGLPTLIIPGGLQPRAALGYSLGALLGLAHHLHLVQLPEFDAAVAEARERSALLAAPVLDNPARTLADRLVGRLPVVYTGTGLLEPVGLRWRTQIHENAKHPAVGNVLPELDHNEIMAFEAGPPALLGAMHVLALRDADDHPQVQRRFEATRDLVAPDVAAWDELPAEGEGRLGRMLSLVQLGDWVSYWLAARKGVDPTPVERIQQLKRALVA